MRRFLSAVALLLLVSSCAVAQDKLPPRVVRVTGTAEVKAVPDRAIIEIGITKQNSKANSAKQAADAVARRILSDLRTLGIDDKDVQTTFLALQPEFDYRSGMKISGFTAEQTLTITVRDLSKLDPLLEALVKAGVNRMDSIRYETSDMRKLRDQARELAVIAAKEKAQALAKALNQDIGKAYSIEEIPATDNPYGYGFAANTLLESAARTRSGPATAPGQRAVSATITVTFDLI